MQMQHRGTHLIPQQQQQPAATHALLRTLLQLHTLPPQSYVCSSHMPRCVCCCCVVCRLHPAVTCTQSQHQAHGLLAQQTASSTRWQQTSASQMRPSAARSVVCSVQCQRSRQPATKVAWLHAAQQQAQGRPGSAGEAPTVAAAACQEAESAQVAKLGPELRWPTPSCIRTLTCWLLRFSMCCMCPYCLQRASCGNMKPVSKAGVLFACPEHTEFDPARTLTYPPKPESCCKVSSRARHTFSCRRGPLLQHKQEASAKSFPPPSSAHEVG